MRRDSSLHINKGGSHVIATPAFILFLPTQRISRQPLPDSALVPRATSAIFGTYFAERRQRKRAARPTPAKPGASNSAVAGSGVRLTFALTDVTFGLPPTVGV